MIVRGLSLYGHPHAVVRALADEVATCKILRRGLNARIDLRMNGNLVRHVTSYIRIEHRYATTEAASFASLFFRDQNLLQFHDDPRVELKQLTNIGLDLGSGHRV